MVKNCDMSSKIRNKTRMSTFSTFIQHSFRSLSHTYQKEKEVNRIQTGKEKVKLSLFADDIMLYIVNLKNASRKLLELVNEFGKVAGYKINTQKSLAFLYTKNERSEREIKETIPFTIEMKE